MELNSAPVGGGLIGSFGSRVWKSKVRVRDLVLEPLRGSGKQGVFCLWENG